MALAPPIGMHPTKTQGAPRSGAVYIAGVLGVALAAAWIGWLSVAVALLVVVGLGAVGRGRALAGGVRRCLRAARERQRRRSRQRARELRLEAAGARRELCTALTTVVGEIESADGEMLERYRLTDLLDLLSDLELTRHHCLTLTKQTDRDELVQRADELSMDPHSAVLRDVASRRLRYWDECAEAVRRCDVQIATIRELIEALRLRIAIPELPACDDTTLALAAQLDVEDAAIAEARALPGPTGGLRPVQDAPAWVASCRIGSPR